MFRQTELFNLHVIVFLKRNIFRPLNGNLMQVPVPASHRYVSYSRYGVKRISRNLDDVAIAHGRCHT